MVSLLTGGAAGVNVGVPESVKETADKSSVASGSAAAKENFSWD
jgi:hypothetical protein